MKTDDMQTTSGPLSTLLMHTAASIVDLVTACDGSGDREQPALVRP